jgi:hypothetical protein
MGERVLLHGYSFTLKNRRKSTSSLKFIYAEEWEKEYFFIDIHLL